MRARGEGDPSHMAESEALARKTLAEAEQRAGSVLRAFRALHVKTSAQGAFVSLPGGLQELVDALVASLLPGTLVTSARVTDLQRGATYPPGTPLGENTICHRCARRLRNTAIDDAR
jgi:protoporphyrinogen oxidase